MAKRQHTHTGECQVCGREQAVTNDNRKWIAKHGYSVEHGFFNGTCWGADAQPIELSKDLLDEAIRRVEQQLANERARRTGVEAMAGTVQGWHAVYIPANERRFAHSPDYRKMDGEYFEVFTLFAKPAHDKDGYNKVMFRDEETGEEFDPRKEGYTYTSALEAAKVTQTRRLSDIDATIGQMVRYIEWQTERRKKWKVQQLKPVKREPPMPTFAKGTKIEIDGESFVLSEPKRALSWKSSSERRIVGWYGNSLDPNDKRDLYFPTKKLKTAKVIP